MRLGGGSVNKHTLTPVPAAGNLQRAGRAFLGAKQSCSLARWGQGLAWRSFTCEFPGWLSTTATTGVCSPGLWLRMLPPCAPSWEGVGLYPPVIPWSLRGQQDFPCLLFQLPFPMHNHTTFQATASLCLSPSQTNLNEPQEQLS